MLKLDSNIRWLKVKYCCGAGSELRFEGSLNFVNADEHNKLEYKIVEAFEVNLIIFIQNVMH